MAGESAREEARRAREKAERLARRAEMFERGAEGETATAAVLSALPPGWTAIHDVRWPTRRLANIDHVLVGPGGIFVIDSKNWSGRITLKNGHLRQGGHSREKVVAGCADAALAVAELAGPYADRVFPVLCFLSDEPMSGWCRDVMVCSTATLTQMLMTRPTLLDPEASTDAWFRLDTKLRAAVDKPSEKREGAATHGARSSRPKAATGRPAHQRRVAARRKKALRQFLTSMLVLVGFLAVGPQIASAVGGLLAEQLTGNLTPSTICKDPAGQRSSQTRGREQQGGGAGNNLIQEPPKHSAGERAKDSTKSTRPDGVSPDC